LSDDARRSVGPVTPTGRTSVGAVIGDPVRHSLSPAIYNAAFAELGLDWVFVAFEVPEGRAVAALDAMRALGLGWLSVTMPHKSEVADAVDRLSDDASALGSVNCVINRTGELVGENTDGAGFVVALRADTGFEAAGASCAVIGAGGAARAVVRALAVAGAAEIVVVNRTRSKAERAVALAGDVGRVGTAEDVTGADLVVNATSVGMRGGDLPVDPDLLRAPQVLVDLIYQPVETALLGAGRSRGLTVANGVGMLVHQAARQFELVTGHAAPLETMKAATRGQLAG
jgi:shikimate dehydrogenase